MIAAQGELDLQTTPLLTRAFLTYRHQRLVLDLAPVTFCGVAGARALHTLSLIEDHVALAASHPVRRVLEITGLGSSLRQYPAMADAVRAVLPAS
ncbi:STAS domain-containing protein [Prauserella oleivorans]|uniref:STAS domain-containing protein n=2 Tax=Prauserella oleivorans TaxID=1478153 RepID=A0ABW5WH58_9PSEU